MPRVELVCLANSYKPPLGRCVAGITVDEDEWVRPVNPEDPGGTIFYPTYITDSGHSAALLDVIEVPLGAASPDVVQPENRDLRAGQWRFKRHLNDRQAKRLLQRHLWTDCRRRLKTEHFSPVEN